MFGESISREDEKKPIIQCIVLRGEGDKMNCLHGHPAGNSTTQNGSFWFCNQSPSCNFFCTEDEGFLFEKAIAAWRSTKQLHPRCDKHGRLTKMRVVKDLMKASHGRPFFCLLRKVNTVFFLAMGGCKTTSYARVPSWIFMCDSQDEKRRVEQRSKVFLLSE